MTETFSERFKRLVGELSDTEVGSIMGTTADAVRKVRGGDVRSIKLDAALRLCKRLGISPWELAGEREPGAIASIEGRRRARVPEATEPDEGEAARDLRAEFEELEADFVAHVEQDLRLIELLTVALGELAAASGATDPLRRASEGLRSLARSQNGRSA